MLNIKQTLLITAVFTLFSLLSATLTAELNFGGFLEDVKVGPEKKAPTSTPEKSTINRVPQSKLDASKLSGPYKGLWRRNWYEFAKRMTLINDYYLICSAYDPRFPSSRHKNSRQFIDEHKVTRKKTMGGSMSQNVTTRPNQTDATVFVEALPKLVTGSYGKIFDGKIVQIISESHFVLDDIKVIDEDTLLTKMNAEETKIKSIEEQYERQINNLERRAKASSSTSSSLSNSLNQAENKMDATVKKMRKDFEREYQFRNRLLKNENVQGPIIVMGVPTINLTKGERWPFNNNKSISLAVCGIYRSVSAEGKKGPSAPLVIPTSLLGKGLDEQGFVKMLESIDITPQDFVDRLGELNKQYRSIDDAIRLYGNQLQTKLDFKRFESRLNGKRLEKGMATMSASDVKKAYNERASSSRRRR